MDSLDVVVVCRSDATCEMRWSAKDQRGQGTLNGTLSLVQIEAARSAICGGWLHHQECGAHAGLVMDREGFRVWSIVLLVRSKILNPDILRLFDHLGRRIPPPQQPNLTTHHNELVLVIAVWYNRR